MIAADTAPPPIERKVLGNFRSFSHTAATGKESWVVVLANAGMRNDGATTASASASVVDRLILCEPVTLSGTCSPPFLVFTSDYPPAAITRPRPGSFESVPRPLELAGSESNAEVIAVGLESLRSVAASVFDNMRPLTEKESLYLERFYRRAYARR